MKTNLLHASLLILAAVALGSAQIPQPLSANIPFRFIAAGKTLPAGDYTVSAGSGSILRLQSRVQHTGAFILANKAYAKSAQPEGRLVFRRHGDQYFFAGAWNAGSTAGVEVFPDKRERELVAAQSAPNIVVVAAR